MDPKGSSEMNIQWYPGHMTKAKRAMEENLKLIDVIIELVDARLPASSRNPDIDRLGKQKYRLILLNKADLADERLTSAWQQYFSEQGMMAVALDSRSRDRMKIVQQAIQTVCKEKFERDRKRGILNRPVRAMVAGIPNVGKSTFINSLAGKAMAKTGNKPGVTRGNQWIRLNKSVELLDTPGLLWPKFEDPEVGNRLALVGSVKDEVLNPVELAIYGILYMREHYPDDFAKRYADWPDGSEGWQYLQKIAELRNALKKGGEPDDEKAARMLLDDLRSGRLGRFTLEEPPVKEEPKNE